MPVKINELMWYVHDRNWVAAALVLNDFYAHGCFTRTKLNLLVRSPAKPECERLRPDAPFLVPHTTVIHLMAMSKPGERDFQGWNAYMKIWEVVAAVLHNDPAIDARAGTPGSGGKTPLMIAAMQNNSHAMVPLLRAGASGLRRVRD